MPPKSRVKKEVEKLEKKKQSPDAAGAIPKLDITTQMQALIDGGYTTKNELEKAQKKGAAALAQTVRRASEVMTRAKTAEQFSKLEREVKEKEARIDAMKEAALARAEEYAHLEARKKYYKEKSTERAVLIEELRAKEAKTEEAAEKNLERIDAVIAELQKDVANRDAEILELAKLKTERLKQKEEFDQRKERQRREGEIRLENINKARKAAEDLAIEIDRKEELERVYKARDDAEMVKKMNKEIKQDKKTYSESLSSFNELLEQDKSIRTLESQEVVFEDDVSRLLEQRAEQASAEPETPEFTAEYFDTARPQFFDDSLFSGAFETVPEGWRAGGPDFRERLREEAEARGGYIPLSDAPPTDGGESLESTTSAASAAAAAAAAPAGTNAAIAGLMAQLRGQKQQDARLMRLKGARNIDTPEIFAEIEKQKMLRCAIAKETYNQGIQSIINKSLYDAKQRNIKLRDEYEVQRRSEEISRDYFLF